MGKMLVSFYPNSEKKLSQAKTELVTTSATSARSSLAAGAGSSGKKLDGGYAVVTAVGVNLLVTTGATAVVQTAGATSPNHPVMAGQSATFAMGPGDRVAAIEFT